MEAHLPDVAPLIETPDFPSVRFFLRRTVVETEADSQPRFQNARFPCHFSVSDSMNSAMLRKLFASITVPDDGKKQYFRQRECQRTCPMYRALRLSVQTSQV